MKKKANVTTRFHGEVEKKIERDALYSLGGGSA
jgi:hypothetical protein